MEKCLHQNHRAHLRRRSGRGQGTGPGSLCQFQRFFHSSPEAGCPSPMQRPRRLALPPDGAISQIGDIAADGIFQAKGKYFSAVELLGGDAERAKLFANGKFATIYLSPRDYHRLHMPLSGTLREMVHVPGCLFSVNAATANTVPICSPATNASRRFSTPRPARWP